MNIRKIFNKYKLCILGFLGLCSNTAHSEHINRTPFSKTPFSEEVFLKALKQHNIAFPEWVYAQAILETGHFTSRAFTQGNNCFGIYNSRKKKSAEYKHWVYSITSYKKLFQKPEKLEKVKDYGKYLVRYKYAEDPNYVQKLRAIMSTKDFQSKFEKWYGKHL